MDTLPTSHLTGGVYTEVFKSPLFLMQSALCLTVFLLVIYVRERVWKILVQEPTFYSQIWTIK